MSPVYVIQWLYNRLIFGTLYPAYSSYKAVKSKDVREYVKWMMYWIIFALFTTVEVITDIFLLPFYYELKIAFVVWLLSPYTKGSSVLYRKFVHPTLSSKEKDIDEYLCQAKDKSYDTLVHFGRKGLNVAATAAVMAATKGQGVLSERLRSFSMQDLSSFQEEGQAKNSSSVTTQPAAFVSSVEHKKDIWQNVPAALFHTIKCMTTGCQCFRNYEFTLHSLELNAKEDQEVPLHQSFLTALSFTVSKLW
uniref:Receptor expression-enhancing protein n=1 Tax=Sinocyclocheilus grahami TaxID=75366 RepID=A0A672QT50_SINGR